MKPTPVDCYLLKGEEGGYCTSKQIQLVPGASPSRAPPQGLLNGPFQGHGLTAPPLVDKGPSGES